MSVLIMPLGGGSGNNSDDCTALKGDVLKGKTTITNDSDDEIVAGTLELTGNAASNDVLSGKTYYNTDAKTKQTGSMANRGAVSHALNAGGSYTIPAGYHNGSGKVTANSLSGQTSGTAVAGQILSGKTAWVNGSKLTGSMPEHADLLIADANTSNLIKYEAGDGIVNDGGYHGYLTHNCIGYYGHFNGNSTWRQLVYGLHPDAVKYGQLIGARTSNADAYTTGKYTGDATAIAGNILSGKTAYVKGTKLTGTMPNIGTVSVSLNHGESYIPSKGFHSGTGKVIAKTRYVKMISAMAVRGFGASAGDYEVGPFDKSFTMPANGIVYYSGTSASYNRAGKAICEIYKNGIIVDQRNIDSDNTWNWRGTMREKSFSAITGDVIMVKAGATSGTHVIASVDAVIEYFM